MESIKGFIKGLIPRNKNTPPETVTPLASEEVERGKPFTLFQANPDETRLIGRRRLKNRGVTMGLIKGEAAIRELNATKPESQWSIVVEFEYDPRYEIVPGTGLRRLEANYSERRFVCDPNTADDNPRHLIFNMWKELTGIGTGDQARVLAELPGNPLPVPKDKIAEVRFRI